MKNEFKIIGNTVEITLNSKKHGDRVTYISLDKLPVANNFSGKWYIYSSKRSNTLYVKGNVIKEDGNRTTIFLHKYILGSNSNEIVDHINGNGLDNRNENLRICSTQENSHNKNFINKNNKTGYRGVTLLPSGNYNAYINIDYKKVNLGTFKDIETANKISSLARTMFMNYSSDVNDNLKYFKEFNDNKNRLIFRYGAMGSGKTELLLISYKMYNKFNEKCVIISSDTNKRDGVGWVKSRNGMKEKSVSISESGSVFDKIKKELENGLKFIIVDEIHFFTRKQIDELCKIIDDYNVNVICYGLMTDFKGKIFETSEYIVSLADDVQTILKTCECGGNAIMNMRLSNGKPVFNGKTIEIGAEERYKSVCRKCYNLELKRSLEGKGEHL